MINQTDKEAVHPASDYSQSVTAAKTVDQTLVVAEEKPWEFTLFRQKIDEDLLRADALLRNLLKALQAGGFAEDPFCRDIEYLVGRMDENGAETDAQSGSEDRTGEIFAGLNRGGKTGRKPHAEKIVKGVGMDPEEVWQALQLKAMKEALFRMCDLLNEISDDVNAVSGGQKDDRAALYFSGRNQAAEAMKLRDPAFQKLLLIQVIKTLSDAGAEVTLEMNRYIEYLKEIRENRKEMAAQVSETAVGVIAHWLEVIHHSYELKAFIYYQQKEFPAMIETLKEYGLFLKNTMMENQSLFAEYDRSHAFLSGGSWEERKNRLQEVIGRYESMLASASAEQPFHVDE